MRYSPRHSLLTSIVAGCISIMGCAATPVVDPTHAIDKDTRTLYDRVLGYSRRTSVGHVGEFHWNGVGEFRWGNKPETFDYDVDVYSVLSPLGKLELKITLTNSRQGWGITYNDNDADGRVDRVHVWKVDGDRVTQIQTDGTEKDDYHFKGFVQEGLKRVPPAELSVLRYFIP